MRNFVFEVITLISVTAIAVLVTASGDRSRNQPTPTSIKSSQATASPTSYRGLCGGIVGNNAVARPTRSIFRPVQRRRLSGVIAGTLCAPVVRCRIGLCMPMRPVLSCWSYLGLRLLQGGNLQAYWKLPYYMLTSC